jgi:hypothetical protein
MHEQFELKLPEYGVTQYVFHLIVVVLMGHINEFSNTTMLDKAPCYIECLIKEATKNRLLHKNLQSQFVLVPSN